MSVAALLYLAAVGSALAFLAWFVSTRRTDPAGYTHIATCSSRPEAERAKKVLEERGIRVRLDDHGYRYGLGGAAPREGPVRLLVSDERVAEAGPLLQSHVALEQRQRYMRSMS
jgi:hypothetical protein